MIFYKHCLINIFVTSETIYSEEASVFSFNLVQYSILQIDYVLKYKI